MEGRLPVTKQTVSASHPDWVYAPARGLRLIGLAFQLFRQFIQPPFRTVRIDVFESLVSCCSAVGLAAFEGIRTSSRAGFAPAEVQRLSRRTFAIPICADLTSR